VSDINRVKPENPITEVKGQTLMKQALESGRIENEALRKQRDELSQKLMATERSLKELREILRFIMKLEAKSCESRNCDY